MSMQTTEAVWFERGSTSTDLLDVELVELGARGRTLECGAKALRKKLAHDAGWFWKVDSWEASGPWLPTSLARRVDIGRRARRIVEEEQPHCMPSPTSVVGGIVGRIWRRALRSYVVESAEPQDYDAFEYLLESFAYAHAARSWAEFEQGVCAHYENAHGLSVRWSSAFDACAPFLRELTDVIVHRKNAHVVFEPMRDLPVRNAGMQAVSLALQLLAAEAMSPDTVLLEGWGPETTLFVWSSRVTFTTVRRFPCPR